MLPPAVTTTVQIGPTVVSATDKPSVSDKIDPSHSDRAAYLSAFKAYCKRFYSNSPPAADRSSLCHFFTLFDASQHSLPAASGGGSTPSHIQLPLHLLPPNLSTNDHDAIRHILQSTGFTADGHMHYSQDLSLYHQTKNRQRRVFHVAVQTAQQQELTHLMATTSFNDLLTKEDRHRDIKNYCALVAAEVGMYPFVLGLSRFLQSQGQNPAAIVQWVLDDAALLQGPSDLVRPTMHLLLGVLGCTVSPPSEKGMRSWTLSPMFSSTDLVRLELAVYLSPARRRATRQRVQATGMLKLTERPQLLYTLTWAQRISDLFWAFVAMVTHTLV